MDLHCLQTRHIRIRNLDIQDPLQIEIDPMKYVTSADLYQRINLWPDPNLTRPLT